MYGILIPLTLFSCILDWCNFPYIIHSILSLGQHLRTMLFCIAVKDVLETGGLFCLLKIKPNILTTQHPKQIFILKNVIPKGPLSTKKAPNDYC